MRLPESEAMNLRTLLFVTVSGAIGVVASLPQVRLSLLSLSLSLSRCSSAWNDSMRLT
jgi:hypothetical protein